MGIAAGDTTNNLISRLGPPARTFEGLQDDILGWQHPRLRWYHGTSVQSLAEMKNRIVWRVIIGKAYR